MFVKIYQKTPQYMQFTRNSTVKLSNVRQCFLVQAALGTNPVHPKSQIGSTGILAGSLLRKVTAIRSSISLGYCYTKDDFERTSPTTV